MKYDIGIIGAGVSGCLIAHALSKYNLDICVYEKCDDVAEGASGANSAIVHSGHDPLDNTNKAKFNLEGSKMYEALSQELGFEYKKCGAFVVACGDSEEKTLEVLYERAKSRNLDVKYLNREEALKLEPNLSDNVTKVISLDDTAIITPWNVCIRALEEAKINGTDVKFNYEIKKLKKENDYFIINEEDEVKVLVNAAGVHADDIARLLYDCKYDITSRKGEYFVLDHLAKPLVNRVIYPVPSEKGKGVLVVPTIHDNTLLGPNSDPHENKDDVATGDALDYVKANVSKTVKNIPFNKIIRTYAGNRPSGNTHDFIIEESPIENFILVACIESPGLASAPAIAKYVSEELVLPKFNATLKEEYKKNPHPIVMAELNDEEKDAMIKKNKDYGKIICRCEKISLGEIKDAINRPLGARSIKGVRRRVRPGMGRCQGGFCEPLVFKILKEELKLKNSEVTYDGPGSEIMKLGAKEEL